MADSQMIGVKEFNKFIVVKTGVETLNHVANTAITEVVVTHGLGYVPAIIGFITDASGTIFDALPFLVFHPVAGADLGKMTELLSMYIDSQLLTIFYETPNVGGGGNAYSQAYDISVKYYLLREQSKAQVQ